MAIKIDTKSIVRTVRPAGSYYTVDELAAEVGGWIDPVKVGPVWVIRYESAKEENHPYNNVASFFFNVPIYGDVLVVPPQQLPLDWDIMDEEDYKFTSEQVDDGFIKSLQQSLFERGNMGGPIPLAPIAKKEFSFTPPAEVGDDTRDFYQQVYPSINVDKLVKDGILLEEEDVIIRIPEKEKLITTLRQMIETFEETEDYEKCANLQRIINTFE